MVGGKHFIDAVFFIDGDLRGPDARFNLRPCAAFQIDNFQLLFAAAASGDQRRPAKQFASAMAISLLGVADNSVGHALSPAL